MNVVINGKQEQLLDGSSVGEAVRAAYGGDVPASGIAVACNGEVVSRAAWEETRLESGDRVEILVATQGG
jgi:sulfur carrier protein